jgi:hypothetical protein
MLIPFKKDLFTMQNNLINSVMLHHGCVVMMSAYWYINVMSAVSFSKKSRNPRISWKVCFTHTIVFSFCFFPRPTQSMNLPVTVRSSLLAKPVELRALYANMNQCTTISSRLARKLGLGDSLCDTYVKNVIFHSDLVQAKTVTMPMIISYNNATQSRRYTAICYPVVNEQAFYDLILGQDAFDQWDESIMNYATSHGMATPGPGFNPQASFMGHNVALAEQLPEGVQCFEECSTLMYPSIMRLAVNRTTRQIVTTFEDDDGHAWLFSDVAPETVALIVYSANDYSRAALATLRSSGTGVPLERFPDTTLVNWTRPTTY